MNRKLLTIVPWKQEGESRRADYKKSKEFCTLFENEDGRVNMKPIRSHLSKDAQVLLQQVLPLVADLDVDPKFKDRKMSFLEAAIRDALGQHVYLNVFDPGRKKEEPNQDLEY